MTAFLHFVQGKSAEYKQKNPDLAHKDIIKMLGGVWKDITDAEKKPFEDLAKADKEKYDKAKKDFESSKNAVPSSPAKPVQNSSPAKKNSIESIKSDQKKKSVSE